MADITTFTGKRTDLITAILDKLSTLVEGNQKKLLTAVIDDFLDKLDTKGGIIQNTLKNKQLLSLFDSVYNTYNQTASIEVIKTIITGVQQIIDFNAGYFAVVAPQTQLAPIKTSVQNTIDSWLGINTSNGNVTTNGYLDTLITDTTVKNQIRNIVVKDIINQSGYNEAKQNLKDYIEGNNQGPEVDGSGPANTGALSKYYRNFVYDTYSQVDRSTANTYADTLELDYAIYEGGIIKTSRPFCRLRNGKVFNREEIQLWGEADPPPAMPPGYNPFTDCGGYGCRHHLNWIPNNVAFALRPDLKDN
jgi:hypothetical protein